MLIVNPTSANFAHVAVLAHYPADIEPTGRWYLLNQANASISAQPLALSAVRGGYAMTVDIPAYSVVGLFLPVRSESVHTHLRQIASRCVSSPCRQTSASGELR